MLIPETYVADLQLRLGLYRRLSTLESRADIDAFAAELVDRFGALPAGGRATCSTSWRSRGCAARPASQQVDAGPKGAVLAFRKSAVRQPRGARRLIAQRKRPASRLQPDQKLVFKADWDLPEERLKGVRALVADLAKTA